MRWIAVYFCLVSSVAAQTVADFNFNGGEPNVPAPFYHQSYITPMSLPDDSLPSIDKLATEEDLKWVLSVSLRLNVWNAQELKYVKFGSATIIKPPRSLSHLIGENEYLALTAGHVCEGGSDKVQIYAEPKRDVQVSYLCTLLGYNKFGRYGDVGLLKFRCDQKLPCAEVIDADYAFKWSEPLIQVGCPAAVLPEARVIRPMQVQHNAWLSRVYFDPAAIRGQSGGGIFDIKKRKLVATAFAVYENSKACAIGPGLADEKDLVVRNRIGEWGGAFFANDLLTFDRVILVSKK